MKRSVISLCVLASFIITVLSAEIIYSSSVAKKLNDALDKCDKSTSFTAKADVCQQLMNDYKERSFLNRLFLNKKLTEDIELSIAQMYAYAKNQSEDEFDAALGALKVHVEGIYFNGF